MASEEVKILGSWQSPYALRTRVALNIKSVAYEYQEEHVLVSKSDLLLNSNPVYKKIPVLLHRDRPICESLVTLEYIDEVWPSGPAILPSHPYDRAISRFWTTYIDVTGAPRLRANLVSDGEDAKKAREDTTRGLDLLEDAFTTCSKGQDFFGGDKIGYLDIALGCFLPWIAVINKACDINLMDESNTPNLFKWARYFLTDAAVKDVLPDNDELYEFSKFLASVLKSSAGTM